MENSKIENQTEISHRVTTNQNATDDSHTGITEVTQAKLAGIANRKSDCRKVC
jgi:hypothetical protein